MRQKDEKQNHSFKRYDKKNSLQCQQKIDFPHKMIKDRFDKSKYMTESLRSNQNNFYN